jgi:hypothetical protein
MLLPLAAALARIIEIDEEEHHGDGVSGPIL